MLFTGAFIVFENAADFRKNVTHRLGSHILEFDSDNVDLEGDIVENVDLAAADFPLLMNRCFIKDEDTEELVFFWEQTNKTSQNINFIKSCADDPFDYEDPAILLKMYNMLKRQ